MPELPEVETIKNELLPQVTGRSFVWVSLSFPQAVRQPSAEEFLHRLPGRRIEKIQRRGKYLLFRLSEANNLILHFKMSGLLRLGSPKTDPVIAAFYLDDGQELYFCDRRRFGNIWLVENESSVIGELGPEPLSPSFTPEVLQVSTSRRRVPIKVLLCEQQVIAGIGNMYADEALFAARIHPLRRSNTLLEEEIQNLHWAIRKVLEGGIKNKGASTDTYRHLDGEEGKAHLDFKVAHRGGQPCLHCETPIQRTPLRRRGTYFCPACQPCGVSSVTQQGQLLKPQPRLF